MNSSINIICCCWRRDYEIINENDAIEPIDVTAIEVKEVESRSKSIIIPHTLHSYFNDTLNDASDSLASSLASLE